MNIKASVQKLNNFLNNLPTIIKNSPKDEQIAYYVIFAGMILLIIGMFLNLLF